MEELKNVRIIESPIMTLGKKTRCVPKILWHVQSIHYKRWLEPFAGSCVVGFTEQPEFAVFSDVIPYGMQFFHVLKKRKLTASFLSQLVRETAKKIENDPKEYGVIRKRFAEKRSCVDYYLLSYFVRNGFAEFNKDGSVSTTFGKILPKKISQAGQVIADILECMRNTWEFRVCSYEKIFMNAEKDDLIYADPPRYDSLINEYMKWTEKKQEKFREDCKELQSPCIVSIWYERDGIKNPEIAKWEKNGFSAHPYSVVRSFGMKGRDAVLVRT